MWLYVCLVVKQDFGTNLTVLCLRFDLAFSFASLITFFCFYISALSEFMAEGSLYNFLHKQKGVFKLPSLIKVAIDVSKGMNYLHQNNIIHRDLKTANLLMDEHEVRGFHKLFYICLRPSMFTRI